MAGCEIVVKTVRATKSRKIHLRVLFRRHLAPVSARVNSSAINFGELSCEWPGWPAAAARPERAILSPVLGLSDEELVAIYRESTASQVARDQAVNELFRRYQSRVAAWCYRVAGDREWAADLAQEVFLRAFRNLGSFRSESKFSTWLYTVSRNHCLNAIEARGLRPEEALPEFGLTDNSTPRPDRQMEEAQEREHVQNLINSSLDETERTVMALHYGDQEMTLASITALLGLENASGAKAYVVSARRKLEAAMARWRAGTQRGPR